MVICWERTDISALVCEVYCDFVTFQFLSLVRCGTLLDRFLIIAVILTLNVGVTNTIVTTAVIQIMLP